MSISERLQAKKAVFDSLYALDEQSDDEADTGLSSSIQALESSTLLVPPFLSPSKQPLFRSLEDHDHTPLARTLSAPSPIGYNANDMPIPTNKQQDTESPQPPQPLELPATLRHRHTVSGSTEVDSTIMPTSSAIPRAIGKRKRDSNIKLVSEEQQIFRGLHFCV